ncbi:MAG TPA: sigma-54 dependent transcriptional regulator [Bacteroidales bacterium]|nr:sigma-54 dependent transcriptional regulator [Bacteroidales bacterium]
MLLIIDDDTAVQASLNLLLKQEGFGVKVASSPAEGLLYLDQLPVELVLLDMNFTNDNSGQEGLKVLQQIRVKKPDLPVILITGWATVPLAVEGMKNGAADFISKPWDNAHLVQSLKTILSLKNINISSTLSRKELNQKYQFDFIIGEDPAFLHVLETVGRISRTDAYVLIGGESGTGKELIAEAIHSNSNRREQPFVKVNLGGISSSLFESEMFGHRKGAFTDARFDRKGRFEIADTGTIFLDEIGELDLNSQVKLLRVLQDKTYEVLGDSKTRRVDVRVISATNRSLEKMIESKHFREDLYYRLNLINIKLPALRERPQDIPLLTLHFMENLKKSYGFKSLTISDKALGWLQQLQFPGNVRELKNLVERTVLLCNKPRLDIQDFSSNIQNVPAGDAASQLPAANVTLDEMEELLIRKNLSLYRNNMSKVAKALGLSRGSLYRRLDKYGIPYDVQD